MKETDEIVILTIKDGSRNNNDIAHINLGNRTLTRNEKLELYNLLAEKRLQFQLRTTDDITDFEDLKRYAAGL